MSMNLENRISNEQLVSRIQSGEDEAENMLKLWEQNRKFITMMARKYAGLAEMEDRSDRSAETGRDFSSYDGVYQIMY